MRVLLEASDTYAIYTLVIPLFLLNIITVCPLDKCHCFSLVALPYHVAVCRQCASVALLMSESLALSSDTNVMYTLDIQLFLLCIINHYTLCPSDKCHCFSLVALPYHVAASCPI